MNWREDKPILVPFDFSEHSKAAVTQALQLAADPANVHVVHVLPFLSPAEPGVVWGMIDDAKRITQTRIAIKKELEADEFSDIQIDVRLGDPGSVIAQLVEELEAGLVVVGSHGRTGISRVVLGSVAERVARLAPCPVLIVKLPAVPVPEAESETEQTMHRDVVIL